MRDGVEERSLADTVHGVHIRPQRQADGHQLHPVGPRQGAGTAGLVQDRDLRRNINNNIIIININNIIRILIVGDTELSRAQEIVLTSVLVSFLSKW